VPHSTPVPVDFRYCPLVPLDAEAVRVPDSVALSRVTAAIVETVVPEVITVVPIVGARYPEGATAQAIPLVAVLEAVRIYPSVPTGSLAAVSAALPTIKSPLASMMLA
jgi:hypothetical protein